MKLVETKCKKIHEIFRQKGYHQVSQAELETEIKRNCGFNRQTVKQYLEALDFYGLIIQFNGNIYQIIYAKEEEKTPKKQTKINGV